MLITFSIQYFFASHCLRMCENLNMICTSYLALTPGIASTNFNKMSSNENLASPS